MTIERDRLLLAFLPPPSGDDVTGALRTGFSWAPLPLLPAPV